MTNQNKVDRHPAYQAAIDADDRFERELERVFGRGHTAEFRYQPTGFLDASLKAAFAAKVVADAAWHAVVAS